MAKSKKANLNEAVKANASNGVCTCDNCSCTCHCECGKTVKQP